MNIDWHDALVIAGVLILSASVYMGLGLPGVLGFVGGALVVTGIVAAWRQERRH